MRPDVIDLSEFYQSPLGQTARELIRRAIGALWPDLHGLAVLGIGYATPYLRPFLNDSERVLAFMTSTQGVLPWPSSEPRLVALVDEADLPLPDDSVDRVLLVHALEFSEPVDPMLREVWRVMNAGGRLLVVVPNRAGLWARLERTPYGYGRPFTPSQLSQVLRDNRFTPTVKSAALYMPPSSSRMWLRAAGAWERFGRRWGRPFSGVVLVEAAKQVYAGGPQRKPARLRRRLYLPVPGDGVPAGP